MRLGSVGRDVGAVHGPRTHELPEQRDVVAVWRRRKQKAGDGGGHREMVGKRKTPAVRPGSFRVQISRCC